MYNEEIFYDESGKALAQVSQRSGGCPIPGDILGHVGWDSEQHDLVAGVIAGGLDQMVFKGPFQPKLFHESVIL